jgi:hypothetical protein
MAGRQHAAARAPSSSSSSLAVCFLPLLVAALLGLHVATGQSVPAAAPVPVRVGVILDWASEVSLRRRTGIEMAVEDYYAKHPGSATRVELHFRDSAGDVVGAASAGNNPLSCSLARRISLSSLSSNLSCMKLDTCRMICNNN